MNWQIAMSIFCLNENADHQLWASYFIKKGIISVFGWN
jgi:hypothetical protein